MVTRQHGVISLAQLAECGLGRGAVSARVRAGRLHRVLRGVYSPVDPQLLKVQGWWMAAVLACGRGSLLSHRCAAELMDLLQRGWGSLHVTSPTRAGRRVAGVIAHDGRRLASRDRSATGAIPHTSLARTLLDLAGSEPLRLVERAAEQAEVLRIYDAAAVEDVLARFRGHHGAGRLAAIAGFAGETLTRSELEELFLAICIEAGVPRPAVNAELTVGGKRLVVDFAWRRERVAVETDGWSFHRTRRAFERDRRRDQLLAAAGWTVARFTWRQVTAAPDEVAAVLRSLLGSRPGTG